MPSSPLSTITSIMKAVSEVKPATILDIGVGFGKFGFLIREYFDLRPGKKPGYDKWSLTIDGIEIFEEYITDVHKFIYDEIYIGNAIKIIEEHNFYYDLVIAVDVLEHFSRKDGIRLIDKMKGISENIIISTPFIYFDQDEMYKNIYEKHLSGWDLNDFMNLGFRYLWRIGVSMVGVYTKKNLDLPMFDKKQEDIINQMDYLNIIKLVKRYFETGQYEECIESSEKYLLIFDNISPELFLFISASCERIGNYEKSLDYAKKAIEIDSNNREAKDILFRLSDL